MKEVSETVVPLHLFAQCPVAVGAAFGAREHIKRHIHIYHQDRGRTDPRERYIEVYHYRYP